MELAKFQRLTNLRFLRLMVSTAPRQFSGISIFSLPALSFLTLPPLTQWVQILGAFVRSLCGHVPIFCRDEVYFAENNLHDWIDGF
jgi:hypothetical protein